MQHIAIDLRSRKSQMCVRASDGTVLKERSVQTVRLGDQLAREPKSKVILESCAEAFAVAAQAKKAGHEVVVVASTLSRSLCVGHRGIKTDQRDAQALSLASCRVELVGVHIPSDTSRERKTICNLRDGLVQARTKLINNVRVFLRQHVASHGHGTPNLRCIPPLGSSHHTLGVLCLEGDRMSRRR